VRQEVEDRTLGSQKGICGPGQLAEDRPRTYLVPVVHGELDARPSGPQAVAHFIESDLYPDQASNDTGLPGDNGRAGW
jgi:hypothetical protein